MMPIVMPLAFYKERKTKKPKRIPLSMNRYRNAQYFESNRAKKEYKETVLPMVWGILIKKPIYIKYTLYADNNRAIDLDNWCIIHSKFFADALVDHGILPDDNTKRIKQHVYTYWWVDKWRWRVRIDFDTNPY